MWLGKPKRERKQWETKNFIFLQCSNLTSMPPEELSFVKMLATFGIVIIICIIIYKQQFLHSDWLRTCQLIPN